MSSWDFDSAPEQRELEEGLKRVLGFALRFAGLQPPFRKEKRNPHFSGKSHGRRLKTWYFEPRSYDYGTFRRAPLPSCNNHAGSKHGGSGGVRV